MSGIGNRFVQAGYATIKPLIQVHHKPMIEWVVSLFPNEHDFIFICREDHLTHTPLHNVLKRCAPQSKIIPIEGHKYGPVYAVKQIYDQIQDQDEMIVNYCDYFMTWDYDKFITHIQDKKPDGSVVCYTGFHPHLVHSNNVYAGCLVNQAGYMTAIKEKYSFTKDKTQSHHSTGLYYFKTGAILKNSFDYLLKEKHQLNGEYYVSMAYEWMLRKKLSVTVYDDVRHFCQWGTPQDLEEYLYWNQR